MEQSELDKWFKFLGYGYPDSLLWFVGIEPGGEQAIEAMPKQDMCSFNNEEDLLYDKNIPGENNRVWSVSKTLFEKSDQLKYFMSNIAPLPRKKETSQLQGIENKKSYHARVINERVKRLVNIHQNNPNHIIVFHGAGARKRYNLLKEFDLDPDSGKCSEPGVLIYETERLILTNSFAYGYTFPNKSLNFVGSLLNEWSKSPHQ